MFIYVFYVVPTTSKFVCVYFEFFKNKISPVIMDYENIELIEVNFLFVYLLARNNEKIFSLDSFFLRNNLLIDMFWHKINLFVDEIIVCIFA